jgi:hypothetical protein
MPGEAGALSSPLLQDEDAERYLESRDSFASSLDLRVQQEAARLQARKGGQALQQQEELARRTSRKAGKLLDSQEREARVAANSVGISA